MRRSRLWMAMVVAGALLGAACDDSKSCDATPPPTCLDALGGGVCGDVAHQPTCADTRWVCPSGTLPQDECDCLGPPPATGCACATNGWTCP